MNSKMGCKTKNHIRHLGKWSAQACFYVTHDHAITVKAEQISGDAEEMNVADPNDACHTPGEIEGKFAQARDVLF